MVLLMASCVSVYHLQSWKHVLSCLKQSISLLRAKAMKRLCHSGANFPCKSGPESQCLAVTFSDIFKILNQGHVPVDVRVWIYMALWDVGPWLNLHVLPTSASFCLMMAFSVLGIRYFTIQDLPFEHRLTLDM